MLLKSGESSLLVIDIQARLLPAMCASRQVVDNTSVLVRAAKRLEVPILASEQYPQGIGKTVPEVAGLLPEGSVAEKVHFSCLGDSGLAARIDALGRRQAVLAGIEAHVCVLQTAEDLLAAGRQVFVVADATSSRSPASHQVALQRLAAAGARIVTTEMVVFEWLARAATPEFRELSRLIK
jgi:nicotinamidase-related amidase